jgi:hypothetical protein
MNVIKPLSLKGEKDEEDISVFYSFYSYGLDYGSSFCRGRRNSQQRPLVNLDHLDFLNEEVTIDEKEMLITHIYSEYPDY